MTDATDLEGRTLGKYQILRPIGAGNMATVYLAQDPFIDRPVAIKVARPGERGGAEQAAAFRRLFFNEAQTAGMLRHPNITAIFDAGAEQGLYYIVMEYVHGGVTLDRHTRPDGLLPLEQCTNLLYQCALALDYAHRKGVIHRDIRPCNLLMTPAGDLKICDFGVAIVQSPEDDLSVEQAGSPRYMSPEQVRGEPLNAQTDLFSLGIVACELLTGQHPFGGGNLAAIRHRTLCADAPALRELRADIPEVYQRIVDKALAKSVFHRYRSGSDMAGDIALVHDFLRASREELTQQEKFARVQALDFFAPFHDLELWEIVNAAEWLEVEPGEEVVREGEHEQSFYVVVDGEVAVRKGARDIVRLRPGECFGEMGLVGGRERSATVAACTRAALMKLRGTVIDRASVNCQLRFQRSFLAALIGRLDAATTQIAAREPGGRGA